MLASEWLEKIPLGINKRVALMLGGDGVRSKATIRGLNGSKAARANEAPPQRPSALCSTQCAGLKGLRPRVMHASWGWVGLWPAAGGSSQGTVGRLASTAGDTLASVGPRAAPEAIESPSPSPVDTGPCSCAGGGEEAAAGWG